MIKEKKEIYIRWYTFFFYILHKENRLDMLCENRF